MADRKPHKCGRCFNPWLEAGNPSCPRRKWEGYEREIARLQSRAVFKAAVAVSLERATQ